MKRLAIAILSLVTVKAHAFGPQEFKTVAQIQAGDVVNVTCSDVTSPTQSHIQFSLKKGQFEGYLTLTAVSPAKGVNVDQYKPEDTGSLKVTFEKNKLVLQGSMDGFYFSRDFFIVIFDTKDGMKGEFSFNDNDGVQVNNRKVVCGANNYSITLN
jgi:hypothetical protein